MNASYPLQRWERIPYVLLEGLLAINLLNSKDKSKIFALGKPIQEKHINPIQVAPIYVIPRMMRERSEQLKHELAEESGFDGQKRNKQKMMVEHEYVAGRRTESQSTEGRETRECEISQFPVSYSSEVRC